MAGVSADLALDIGPALREVSRLDTALGRTASHFGTEIARALAQLSRGASVDVRADTASLARSVERALDSADTSIPIEAEPQGIRASVENALQGADTSVEVTGTVSPELAAGLDRATEKSHNLRGALLGVSAIAATTGAALGAAVIGAAGFGVKLAADLEQARIGFTSMLGSAEEADALLGDLRDFANTSPFEFPDVVEGSRRLLAMGIAAEDLIPTMTSVGNAVAAMGGGKEQIDSVTRALGQMNAKGKVSAEEMLQLAEAGIPAWDMLAQHLGKSVQEVQDMVTNGEVAASTFREAFDVGVAERFGNAMQAQSQTLLGLWSTLKDTISTSLTGAAQPLLASLSAALPQVQELLGGLIDDIGPELGRALGTLVPVLAQALAGLAPVIGVVVELLSSLFTAARPAIEAIATALANLSPVFNMLVTAAQPLFDVLARAIMALAPHFGTLVEIVGRLASAALPILASALGVVAPLLESLAGAVLPVINRLVVALEPGFEAIGEAIDACAPAFQDLAEAGNEIMAALEPVIQQLAGSFVEIMRELAPVIPDVARAFAQLAIATVPLIPPLARLALLILPPLTDLLVLILPPLVRLMALNYQVTATLIGAVATALGALADALRIAVEAVVAFVSNLDFTAMLQGVQNALNSVVEFFMLLPGRITGALGDLGGFIWGHITGGFEAVVSNVSAWAGRIVDLYAGLPGRAIAALGNLGGAIWGAIVGGLDELWRFISGRVDGIVSLFTGIPGRLAGLGEAMANALVRGFQRAWNAAANAINSIIPNSIDLPFGLGVDLPDNPVPTVHVAHAGGVTPGPRGSEVPAMLLGGERVLSLPQTKLFDKLLSAFGAGTLRAPAGAAGAGSLLFNINVYGVTDPAKARSLGSELGNAAADALIRRKVVVAARTGGVG